MGPIAYRFFGWLNSDLFGRGGDIPSRIAK
jgi:hypothetical protein